MNSPWKNSLRVVVFHGICWSFRWLSKMALINLFVFVVLKILHNLVFMQNSLLANNCWHKQNFGKCQGWHDLCFECTVFAWICLVLETRNVVSFIKTWFYWKRGCGTLRYCVETFQCNSMYYAVHKLCTQILKCRK